MFPCSIWKSCETWNPQMSRVGRFHGESSIFGKCLVARLYHMILVMILVGLLLSHLLKKCTIMPKCTTAATTCRRRFDRAVDSMREQYWAKSATTSVSTLELPVLNGCVDLDHVRLTFHVIYMLGHDCFGSYFCRIEREATERCHLRAFHLPLYYFIYFSSVKRSRRSPYLNRADRSVFSSSIIVPFMLKK